MQLQKLLPAFMLALFVCQPAFAQKKEGDFLDVVGFDVVKQRYADGGDIDKGRGLGEVKATLTVHNARNEQVSDISCRLEFFDDFNRATKNTQTKNLGSVAPDATKKFEIRTKGIRSFVYYRIHLEYTAGGTSYFENWMGIGEGPPVFLPETLFDTPGAFILIDDMESLRSIRRTRRRRYRTRKGDFDFTGLIKNTCKYSLKKIKLVLTFSPEKPKVSKKSSRYRRIRHAKTKKAFSKTVRLFHGAPLQPGQIKEFDFKLRRLPAFKSYHVKVEYDCPDAPSKEELEKITEPVPAPKAKPVSDTSNANVHLTRILVRKDGEDAVIEVTAKNVNSDTALAMLNVTFTLQKKGDEKPEDTVVKFEDIPSGESRSEKITVSGGGNFIKWTYKMSYGFRIKVPAPAKPDTAAEQPPDTGAENPAP